MSFPLTGSHSQWSQTNEKYTPAPQDIHSTYDAVPVAAVDLEREGGRKSKTTRTLTSYSDYHQRHKSRFCSRTQLLNKNVKKQNTEIARESSADRCDRYRSSRSNLASNPYTTKVHNHGSRSDGAAASTSRQALFLANQLAWPTFFFCQVCLGSFRLVASD